jgi:hypothetical protein
MNVNEISQSDVTSALTGTMAVEVGDDVLRTPDVEVAVDASTQAHSPINCRRHQYCCTRSTCCVERLVQAVVT